jgi:hypothetical protein
MPMTDRAIFVRPQLLKSLIVASFASTIGMDIRIEPRGSGSGIAPAEIARIVTEPCHDRRARQSQDCGKAPKRLTA